MNPNLRRILLIAAFVLVALGFFFVIYLVFFRPSNLAPTNNGAGNINGLPNVNVSNANRVGPVANTNTLPAVNAYPATQNPSNIAEGGPTYSNTIFDQKSSNLIAAGDGFRFYDSTDGKFYQVNADGTAVDPLTDTTYRDASAIAWSPDGSQAILSFPDGSKILYNFTTKKQTTLPKELNDFSFSPQSDQIVSKYLDPSNTDNQWLIASQPDGTQSTTVEHLGENAGGVIPLWSPNNQIVATYEESVNSDLSQIIFLGLNGENFPSATIEGRGFTPKWSPDGRKILYSAYSAVTNDNPHLYIMNGTPDNLGSGLVDLGLDTTANKCVFSATSQTAYCAVPYYLNPGSGPDPSLSAGVPDNIYRVNLSNGTTDLIARPVDRSLNQRFSATNLQLTPSEDALYFLDTISGTVQKVRLR